MRLVGSFCELASMLSQRRYDLVFMCKCEPSIEHEIIHAADEQGIDVWYFAQLSAFPMGRLEGDDYGVRPVIIFKTTSRYEGRLVVKRIFDLCHTRALLVVLSPLFLIIAGVIKVSSKGPIFFSQMRAGWRSRPFRMLKFRTMVAGAEEQLAELANRNEMKGPVFKRREYPRILSAGRFLRRFSLDELPQLFNILRGEMSLVGPRSLPLPETRKFEAFRDHRRYSVLPGLTGPWQVLSRSDIDDCSE